MKAFTKASRGFLMGWNNGHEASASAFSPIHERRRVASVSFDEVVKHRVGGDDRRDAALQIGEVDQWVSRFLRAFSLAHEGI